MAKNNASAQRAPLGAVLIALGLALALAIAAWSASNQPTVAESHTPAPRLSVEQAVIDAGIQPMGVWVEPVFCLSNTGNAPLTLVAPPQVENETGDAVAQVWLSDTTVAPGEAAWLSLRLRAPGAQAGPCVCRVPLGTNDSAQPVVELVFRVTFD